RDDPAGAGREAGGEHTFGDADLGLDLAALGNLLDDPLGGALFAAEVAGRAAGSQRTHARPERLNPGREILARGAERVDPPRVAARVVLDHDQARAPALGLPLAQAAPDALGAGGG